MKKAAHKAKVQAKQAQGKPTLSKYEAKVAAMMLERPVVGWNPALEKVADHG